MMGRAAVLSTLGFDPPHNPLDLGERLSEVRAGTTAPDASA